MLRNQKNFFLDRGTISPDVVLRRANFQHEWTDFSNMRVLYSLETHDHGDWIGFLVKKEHI